MIILESNPAPNQTINIGANANIGITWEAIKYGRKDLSKIFDKVIEKPKIDPKKMAKNNPIKISNAVTSICRKRNCFELKSSVIIAKGDGKSQGSNTWSSERICQINIRVKEDNKGKIITEKFFRKLLVNWSHHS